MQSPADPPAPPPGPGDDSQLPSGSFAEFNLPDAVMRGLAKLGFSGPTPVQRESFAPVMEGHDVIVQAKTGSGKTSAFGIPIVTKLGEHGSDVRALALCPTRELASQVAKEISTLSEHTGLRVVPIYGGASFGPQISALQAGADVVVGTPGRILDHMRRGTLRLKAVQLMVLDEADEMLSMGFWDEVTTVLDALRHPHQTMLFSATLPPAIQRAASRYLNEPQRIELSGDELTVANITNAYYTADERLPKPRNLLYVIETEKPEAAIVFCNRKDETELVFNVLRRFGFNAGLINSNLSQSEREWVMGSIKSGALQILVATDVAARGIDISDLSHVFNYDLPEHTEVYVHRAGRTGRIGKRGTAVSLVRGVAVTRLNEIARQFEIEFEERTLPEAEVIVEQQSERILKRLADDAAGVETSQYRGVADLLRQRDDAADAIAFLLRSYFSEAHMPSQRTRGGASARDAARQSLSLDAGSEQGLTVDSLLTLLADVAESSREMFGTARIEPNECSVETDAETARILQERSSRLVLADGTPLTMRLKEERRRPERKDGRRRGGGPRSRRGGGKRGR